MRARKSALRGPSDKSGARIYEVHGFIPGRGFKAAFYPADSREMALELFKQEHPTGEAFWIEPTRGKAVSGPPAVKYRVWWKSYGGDAWYPHLVFMFDANDNLLGSVPEYPESITKEFWAHALNRVGSPKHRIEEVSQSDASLIANEILGAHAIERDKVIDAWNAGKLDTTGGEDLPDMDWPELGRPNLLGVDNVPRPEMWDLESVKRAVEDGFTFGLPFKFAKNLFDPNAYWIGGHQYTSYLLTMGPEHTPELALLPDGWLRVKLFFQPGMVPERTWLGPPNEHGVVAVYGEIDPETVNWDQLNRGEQIRVPKGFL